MRQKRVLLAFVKAVNLVNKHDGSFAAVPTTLAQPDIGLLDCFTNVFDAAQHRRHGDEMRIKAAGHQSGDGGFTHAGWPPQNTAVWLA